MAQTITKQLVRDALEDEIIFGSGHDIMLEDFYDKYFDVSHLVQTFKSDFSDHKSTIFVNGEAVEELKGIYNLSFLHWLATEIGLTSDDYGSYTGRGFQAQAMERAIRGWAKEEVSSEDVEGQEHEGLKKLLSFGDSNE